MDKVFWHLDESDTHPLVYNFFLRDVNIRPNYFCGSCHRFHIGTNHGQAKDLSWWQGFLTANKCAAKTDILYFPTYSSTGGLHRDMPVGINSRMFVSFLFTVLREFRGCMVFMVRKISPFPKVVDYPDKCETQAA